jgi:3-hydroxyisobutyrate dehydrogenase
MASAAGFDPATIVPAVNQLTGASYASQVKMEKFVLSGTYDSGFPVRSLMTDLENGAEWFSLLANPPVFCAATYATWSQAAQELGADADHTAVAQWLERRNGVSLAQGQSSHSPGVETTTT